MPSMNRRNILAGLAVAPFASELVVRASDFGQTSREMLRENYFPNFELVTHEGKKVRFYDDLIKDKIVVINFMYAKCDGICVPVTMKLKKVQEILGDRIGRDIFMYSITLKPKEDTPEKLHHYVHMHRVKPGWTFLTGRPDEIEILRRKLGFSDGNPKLDKDLTNHIGMVKYGNERRQWWAMFPGKGNPAWMVKSILWMDERKKVQVKNTST
jgi:protein SCO1